MSFIIKVLPETMEKGKSSAIPGKIWIQIDSKSVPCEEWWDFPVPILGWWCDAISDFLENKDRIALLDFMDGPFTIHAQREETDACSLVLEKRRINGPELTTIGRATLSKICSALLESTALVLKTCTEKGWQTDDVKYMERSAVKLRAAIPTRMI